MPAHQELVDGPQVNSPRQDTGSEISLKAALLHHLHMARPDAARGMSNRLVVLLMPTGRPTSPIVQAAAACG